MSAPAFAVGDYVRAVGAPDAPAQPVQEVILDGGLGRPRREPHYIVNRCRFLERELVRVDDPRRDALERTADALRGVQRVLDDIAARLVSEAAICDETGHEMRPAPDGRIACACCGVPDSTSGTKGEPC